jgi:hypothetical protein
VTAKKRKATKKSKAPAKKPGRTSSFSESLALRLLELAKGGATDKQLAAAAGVSLRAFHAWKGRHPDFKAALRKAKDVADELVEASLYMRAVGFSHPAVKFFCHEGRVVSKRYREQYAPDTTAAIFWLKNRRPDLWRDAQKIDLSGGIGAQVVVTLPSNGREASA